MSDKTRKCPEIRLYPRKVTLSGTRSGSGSPWNIPGHLCCQDQPVGFRGENPRHGTFRVRGDGAGPLPTLLLPPYLTMLLYAGAGLTESLPKVGSGSISVQRFMTFK